MVWIIGPGGRDLFSGLSMSWCSCMVSSGVCHSWIRILVCFQSNIISSLFFFKSQYITLLYSVCVCVCAGMAKFLRRFRILGSLWFVCFPVLVLLAGLFIAPYHRHGLITGASLIGQSAALSLLCWTMLRPSSQFFRGSTLKQMGTVFGGVTGFRGGKLAVD